MNTRFAALLLTVAAFSPALPADARTRFERSVRLQINPIVHRVRDTLTSAELAAPMTVVVSLQMRNFAELESRLANGERISHAEMEARYLPLKSDHDRINAWLTDQGFSPTLVDSNHTNIFVRAPVARIAAAFEVGFARVSDGTAEYTSAVSAPALPEAIAEPVLGIEGLQPELRMRSPESPTVEADSTFVHPTRAIPADILAAYHAPANLDGTGQAIAIVAGDIPLSSDLAAFYQAIGLQHAPAPLIVKPVNGGPTVTDTSNEVTMDVEWSSAVAPGAQVILYATPTYSIADLLTACTQILNDGKATIVSNSASGLETSFSVTSLESSSQVFAQMAAAGITILHGSGDNGSTGVPVYPSSDPFVTSFAGTTLTFDANWNVTSEVVWPNTGSGVSTVFARPSWQKGSGVPAGTMRCVPDAASLSTATSAFGASFPLTIHDGRSLGVGGDSLTGPVWAGLVALINQARATNGLPAIGFLAPRLYPLIGTAAFNDITSGSNGAYTAGPGYDMCSGVGSPNVTELVRAFTTSEPPSIVAQPTAVTIAGGTTAVFTTAAFGLPAPAYQWFRDASPVSGATNAMLVLRGSAAIAGNYTCTATNTWGSITTLPAALAVASPGSDGRLVNLSILTSISASSSTFTVGTVVAGASAADLKPLLIRGDGPSLVPFGVSDAITDPKIDVFSGETVLASNDNWGGSQALADLMHNAGAFPFGSPDSKDAAVYLSGVASGDYTVQVTGANGATGSALAELYDLTPASTPSSARLVNMSVLKNVGATETLTAGFVIAGDAAETVLIRAIGPRLGTAPFNLPGVMPDPQLTLFGGDSVAFAANDNWGGDPQLTAAGNAVAAFDVPDPTSRDAMLLVTLAPGRYTAQVTDVSRTGGLVIVEVYELR